MVARTYQDASSYAPVFPSPLNPTNHGPENKYATASGRIVRRRRSRQGRRGPPGSHTLTQRLLRVKAADAWRGHVLSAQVAQYEYAEAAIMGYKSPPKSRVSSSSAYLSRIVSNTSLELSVFNARPQEPRPQLLTLRRPPNRQQHPSSRSHMSQDKTHAARHGSRRPSPRSQGPRYAQSS
jgi:hypothetical protein